MMEIQKKQEMQTGSASPDIACYFFRLYVTGASPNSSRAITNFKAFLEKHLKDEYELEIIDVYQQPHVAQSVDIIALPMLIREFPLPKMRLIGDMSNHEKLNKVLSPVDYKS
jgi:circadian clock protein KaiB